MRNVFEVSRVRIVGDSVSEMEPSFYLASWGGAGAHPQYQPHRPCLCRAALTPIGLGQAGKSAEGGA